VACLAFLQNGLLNTQCKTRNVEVCSPENEGKEMQNIILFNPLHAANFGMRYFVLQVS
jgi:hypothetical protein